MALGGAELQRWVESKRKTQDRTHELAISASATGVLHWRAICYFLSLKHRQVADNKTGDGRGSRVVPGGVRQWYLSKRWLGDGENKQPNPIFLSNKGKRFSVAYEHAR